MKKISFKSRLLMIALSISVFLASCSSSTYITTYPEGADLYLDGESVGHTPYRMTDTKPMFSCTDLRMEKEGYRTFYTTICRDEAVDVGAIVGGFFLWIPFLWSFKYKPTHNYKLISDDENKKASSFEELINAD